MTATLKRKSRKATKDRPSPVVVLTPNTKKAKKVMDTAILKAAAMDVLRLRNGEGTRAIYGSMNRVIARYQSHQHLVMPLLLAVKSCIILRRYNRVY
jgi:hypothetical protein